MSSLNIALIGGGPSIKGNEESIRSLMPNCFSIGINYSYKYFKTDMQVAVDPEFISSHLPILNSFPISVVRKYTCLKHLDMGNTIALPIAYTHKDLGRIVTEGVYCHLLSGLFAMTLTLHLFLKLGRKGNIYMFGFDSKGVGKDAQGKELTHFYQGDGENHRGIGFVDFYNKANHHALWDVYSRDIKTLGINVYNVSPQSAIDNFKKIDYKELPYITEPTGLDMGGVRKIFLGKDY